MKFALVNGQRHEAKPKLSGQCPACDRDMVAKCGEVRVPHWAHKGRLICDPWWENETEWHRSWKGHFPESWQEFVQKSDSGEKHIADVKTDQGWVIEFQHSHIKPEERESRDFFYPKLAWVVDGTRRSKDYERFRAALENGLQIDNRLGVWRVRARSCALFREWETSKSKVLFDFGGEQALWLYISGLLEGWSYVAQFPRVEFIEIHRGDAGKRVRTFEDAVAQLRRRAEDYEESLRAPRVKGDPLQAMLNAQRSMPRNNWGRRR